MNRRKCEHYCSVHIALVESKDFRKGAMYRRVGTVQCVACLTLLSLGYIGPYEGVEGGPGGGD